MSDQAAPDSPSVTYPPDAARPGYIYRDHYPDSPDPMYVPIQGDEDYVESNSTNLEDSGSWRLRLISVRRLLASILQLSFLPP